MPKSAIRKISNKFASARNIAARYYNTHLLHGPAEIRLADSEVCVTVLLKDASYFIRYLLQHSFAIGAKHVLIIDNGSSDSTIGIASEFNNVTIVRNTLPVHQHESNLRSEISKRYIKGGWVLFVDADEIVELPGTEKRPISALTEYCLKSDFTAVVGQMLDRFSQEPYSVTRTMSYEQSVQHLNLYSTYMINTINYADHEKIPFHYFLLKNRCADPGVQFKQGGLRLENFGENPFLSKHSLVRNVPGVSLMTHPHCASNVNIADVTLLLHHYKLAGDFISRDRRAVGDNAWRHGADLQRVQVVGDRGAFRIAAEVPQTWAGYERLVTEGFLYASPAFRLAQDRSSLKADQP